MPNIPQVTRRSWAAAGIICAALAGAPAVTNATASPTDPTTTAAEAPPTTDASTTTTVETASLGPTSTASDSTTSTSVSRPTNGESSSTVVMTAAPLAEPTTSAPVDTAGAPAAVPAIAPTHVAPTTTSTAPVASALALSTVEVAPSTPLSVKAAAGNASVTISWTAPSSSGSAPIGGYTIFFAPAGGAWGSVNVSASARSRAFTLLRNGTTYYFRMIAFSTAGQSLSTSSVSAVPRTAPSVARSFTATPGNGRVTLRWTAPASNGGSPILGYSVFYAQSGGAWQRVSFSPRTSYIVTGLSYGVGYYFRLTAYNVAGSAPSTASLRAVPFTMPAAPTLTASAGDRRATLRWAAPATNGSPITRYAVQRSTSPTSGWVYVSTSISATATSFTATGLTNGVRYYFRVAASNAAGMGPWSAAKAVVPAAPVVTPPPPPPPPSPGCSPSYPTVCIPPPPPDLDCGDVSYRRFTVLSPDPHNFDADHDGVGCEAA
jgi:Fibronectin type III domain